MQSLDHLQPAFQLVRQGKSHAKDTITAWGGISKEVIVCLCLDTFCFSWYLASQLFHFRSGDSPGFLSLQAARTNQVGCLILQGYRNAFISSDQAGVQGALVMDERDRHRFSKKVHRHNTLCCQNEIGRRRGSLCRMLTRAHARRFRALASTAVHILNLWLFFVSLHALSYSYSSAIWLWNTGSHKLPTLMLLECEGHVPSIEF